jgi:transcriptional antiterminator NusG
MPMHWFVLRVQSNKEDRVRESLVRRAAAAGTEGRIGRVLVPSAVEAEIKAGKRRVRETKIYPGYVMVELETEEGAFIPDDLWFLIRDTPGVGDFVGSNSRRPQPMAEHEVEKLLGEAERREEAPQIKIDFEPGESVKIKEGPFENFDGVVDEIIPSKGLVRVIVTIFGRATPVELEYWQIESI